MLSVGAETLPHSFGRQEEYQAEIEDLLSRDTEEHTKLKIKLETDIQVQRVLYTWALACVCKKSALEKNVNSRVDISPGDVVSSGRRSLSCLLTGVPNI